MPKKEQRNYEFPDNPELLTFLEHVIVQTIAQSEVQVKDLTQPSQAFYYLKTVYVTFKAYSEAVKKRTGENPLKQVLSPRRLTVVDAYFTTDLSASEIAEKLQCTRQNVYQMITAGMKKIYEHLPSQLQEKFPEPLPERFFKLTSQNPNMKIREMLQQGKSIEEIQEKFAPKEIWHARHYLKEWGMELPYTQLYRSPEFAQVVNTLKSSDASNEEIQHALDSLTMAHFFSMYNSEDPAVFSCRKLIAAADLHVRPQQVEVICRRLQELHIPLRILETETVSKGKKVLQKYYLVAQANAEQVIELFQTHAAFAEFKQGSYEVLGKPTSKFPLTPEFRGSSTMVSLWLTLRSIEFFSDKKTFSERVQMLLDENCPVSIYVYINRQVRIYKKDVGLARKYFQKRVEEFAADPPTDI